MTQDITRERPLVTFALFAYNQEKYIREAVEGAFSQTYEPLEIILSDDCSNDRTFEIMQEMATAYEGPHQIVLRKNISNLGLSGHINKLLECTSGEYVSWAAGDDIAFSNKIKELVRPVLRSASIVGVHSSFVKIDTAGNLLPTKTDRQEKENLSLNSVISECASVVSQSHLFKTSVFHKFGPFEDFLTNEGPAMTFRELSCGTVQYINTPLTKYRIGSGVSTYRGGDSKKIKFTEPVKITEWRLSSYRQILKDIQNTEVNKIYETEVQRKIRFYQNLTDLNQKKQVLSSLVKNTLLYPRDLTSLRAFVRLALPDVLYNATKILKRGQ